jgi:hypothetical protein
LSGPSSALSQKVVAQNISLRNLFILFVCFRVKTKKGTEAEANSPPDE